MIDLHSHVLPGVDDGAGTIEDSLALARAAVADGIVALAATPHVRDDFPTSPDTMERLVGEVRAALAGEGVPLELLPGGEIALELVATVPIGELRRFGLAGNASYLLVEMPYRGWPLVLEQRLFELRTHGVTPVLAHPERNDEVQARPERLGPLVGAGSLVQVTAASLDGRLGGRSRSTGLRLVELGLAHLVASDAHSASMRMGMSAATRALGDEALARWLVVGVPGAIVRGERLPPRPEQSGRGLLRRLLGR